MAEHIKIKSKTSDDETVEFDKFFPSFIWAVRDFTLDLEVNGKVVTADDYLEHALSLKSGAGRKVADYNLPRECIRTYFPHRRCFVFPRPVDDQNLLRQLETLSNADLQQEFQKQSSNFLEHVYESSRVKAVSGRSINGRMLGGMVSCYVEAIRNGAVPCIESAVETTAKLENERALQETLEMYKRNVKESLRFPTETMLELSDCHHVCEKDAAEYFLKLAIFDSEKIYYQRMMDALTSSYEEFVAENEAASRNLCKSLLHSLHETVEEDFKTGKYARPGGYEDYRSSMDSLVKKYRETPNKGVMSEEVLNNFLKQQEATSASVLNADEKLTEEIRKAEEERQKAEASERQKKAAEDELRMKEQLMADQKRSFEEHIHRLEKQSEEDRIQMQKQNEMVLEKRLKEQDRLLREGFDEKAKAMDEDLQSLRKTIDSQKNSGNEGGFWDFLGKFIPFLPPIFKVFRK